jgi:NAD(P)-dependent dehydrogenase (short-subunit alcohol dehydrogenase family)
MGRAQYWQETDDMTDQLPIPSGFGMRSTASDVIAGIDLHGKIAVVTGGYSGLGLETVRAIAGAGAKVIVAARRPDAAAADLAGIDGVTILNLDLSNPDSIDAFAAEVAMHADRIDILINNAAIMANPLTRDARGFESQFATNHLGHFQMTARLWPLLKAAGDRPNSRTRVVALSSIGHARNGLDLDDVNFERRDYEKWTAYGQAKSANALFALHLDALGAPLGIRAFSVHPGGIKTPLQRYLTMDEQIAMGWFKPDGSLIDIFKTVEQGAATSIWCATSPMLDGKGGVYCEDCDIAPMWEEGMPRYSGVRSHIRDRVLAAALWRLSEDMTGVAFR